MVLYLLIASFIITQFAPIKVREVVRRKYVLLCFLLSSAFAVSAQNIKRTFSSMGSDFNTGTEKLVVLGSDLYAYGFGGNNLSFTYGAKIPSSGSHKLFVAKYNDTGLYLKSKLIGGFGANLNGYAARLNNSLICLSGVYSGGYVDGNAGILASDKKGMFVTAMDSGLNTSWRLFLGANDKFHCNLLCSDGKGNMYAAGYFSDTINIAGTRYQSTKSVGQTENKKDIFLILIAANGSVLNAQIFGGPGNDYPTSLGCDRSGNALLGAMVSDTVQLGDVEYKQQSKARAIVFKVSKTGHNFWITSFNGPGASINGMAWNNANQVVCATAFKSSLLVKAKNVVTKLNTSADNNQMAVLRLDSFGNLLQYVTESSINDITVAGLCLDPSDNVFVAGEFDCTFTGFNAKNPKWSFKNAGFGDIYVAAYSASLTALYQRQFGGKSEDKLGGLIYSKNGPTICGIFTSDLQLTCDSNILVTYEQGNIGRTYDYYLGYAPGPFSMMYAQNYDWMEVSSGFVTDIVKESRLLNLYQTTYQKDMWHAIDAEWERIVQKQPHSYCYQGRIRYFWFKQYTGSNPWGINMSYKLNGASMSYYDVQNHYFNATAIKTLTMQSEDACYADTLKDNIVVVPHKAAVIEYDYVKYPDRNRILICNGDSICLKATNTNGLNYLWRVVTYEYVLDTGNIYQPEDKWVYKTKKIDTFYSQTICVSKRASVSLEVEKNDLCVEGTQLWVEQDGLGPDDSMVFFFQDTVTHFCHGGNTPYESFLIRVLDKKTGLYRIANIWVDIRINNAYTYKYYQQTFSVPIPDTGYITVKGYAMLGCQKFNFDLKRKIYKRKPKIAIDGNPSNCRSVEQIFSVDSNYFNYRWSVQGKPVTPEITYINPWKIKVKGSVQYINIYALADTSNDRWCSVDAFKSYTTPQNISISPSINPPQLCPGQNVTLTATAGATSYRWFPTGETTRSIVAVEPGVYYCVIKDTAECEYNTNTINVLGYFDPDIIIVPDDGICPGQDAELFVIAPESATVQWTSPSAWGNKRHIKTNQLGTFYCNVTTCNKTYKLNAKIVSRTIENKTLKFNHEICKGQTIKLSCHDSEGYAYNWVPGAATTRSIAAKNEGAYTVWAKDACDQWYAADEFTIVHTNQNGANGYFDTLICGLKPTTLDVRRKYVLEPDSLFTHFWMHDGDTSMSKGFVAGSGNYKALVQNKYCKFPDTFYLGITNLNQTGINVKPVADVCINDYVELEATLSDSNATTSVITWSHGLGNGAIKSYQAVRREWLYAVVKDTCGIAMDSVRVNPVIIDAVFQMSYDGAKDEVTLTNASTGVNIVAYRWYINNVLSGTNETLTMPSPEEPGSVACLEIENDLGCVDSVCKPLPLYNKGVFHIPTAFRPNSGLAANQRFMPFGKLDTKYSMTIYNRWGEKLFDGGSHTNGWDGFYMGSRCPNGIYIYVIQLEYTDIQGDPAKKLFQGTVMIQE